jgi:hypothetical protein
VGCIVYRSTGKRNPLVPYPAGFSLTYLQTPAFTETDPLRRGASQRRCLAKTLRFPS